GGCGLGRRLVGLRQSLVNGVGGALGAVGRVVHGQAKCFVGGVNWPRRAALDLTASGQLAMNGPATNEALMSLPRTVAAVLKNHVTLEVESIDRMYLNVYVPLLQTDSAVAY